MGKKSKTEKPIVWAKDVYREYKLGKDNIVKALRGASMEVKRGEFVAIIGPSGAGKSTLMHILGCLDTPTKGEVWIDGVDVTKIKRKKLPLIRSDKVGFVFQGFNLLPGLTALENVVMAGEYAGLRRAASVQKAKELLEEVGLKDRLKHRPTMLSGGEQQRVTLARALVNDPAIVLADEPTGELDTATAKDVMKMLRKFNKEKGQTFVIVSHNLEVAKECDRIIEIVDGKVVK